MHLTMVTLGRAVIGCSYGALQSITALPKVTIYSLIALSMGLCFQSLFSDLFIWKTRMHSSRMHTGQLVTVFQRLLLWGGTCSQGGYLLPGGWVVPAPGVYLVPGGVWSGGVYLVPGGYLVRGVPGPEGGVPGPGRGLVRYSPPPPWTEWMTDRCKNITLAKTSFRPVIS